MSNHFLHGSVKEIYRTVVNDLPQTWSKLIPPGTEALLAYGSHGDPDHYSLVPLETQEGTKLLFSRCSRKQGAKSPSYYVHKQLLDADMDTLFHRFDALLDTPFCSEANFDQIAENPNQIIVPDTRWDSDPVQIHPEVLYSILHAMLSRWRNGSEPVVVLVPQMSAAEYNRYTSGAVRVIYSCLPAAIRGKVGFMTYSAPVKQLNAVGLYFLPEVHTSNGIYLDRVTEKTQSLTNSFLPESVKALLTRIANDPEHRQEELQDLWDIVESGAALADIREKHYTAYLTHAPLLHLQTSDTDQFQTLLDFFYNRSEIPEALHSKLAEKLRSRLKPEDLDTPLLNRQDQDSDFRAYLTRIRESERLCTCSDAIKAHASQKLTDAFESYLTVLTDTQQLDTLDQYLVQLSESNFDICPEAVIKACSEKWRIHAQPVYIARLDAEVTCLVEKMNTLSDRKAPENATFTQICQNDPLNFKQECEVLESELSGYMKKLPDRLGLTPEQMQHFTNTFSDKRNSIAEALESRYLDAAQLEQRDLLTADSENLSTQLRTLRTNLATQLSFLPISKEKRSAEQLGLLDKARENYWVTQANDLLDNAEKKLAAANDPDVDKLYKQVKAIQTELSTALSNLHSTLFDTKLDTEAWYLPFYNKSEQYFKDLLKYDCKLRSTLEFMTPEERNVEQKRLEELIRFLSKYYKKESDLKEQATDSLNKLKKSAQSSKKTKKDSNDKKTGYTSKKDQQTEITNSTVSSNFVLDSESKPPYIPNPNSREAAAQEDAGGDIDTFANMLSQQNKQPAQDIPFIQVSGITLSKWLEELTAKKEVSDCVNLYIVTPNQMTHIYKFNINGLEATLEWLRTSSHIIPDNLHEKYLDSLLPYFQAAALTPKETANFLHTLLQNNAYHEVATRFVDQIIGHPSSWKNSPKEANEIRRLLRKHPRCAAADPEWLNSQAWKSPFAAMSGLFQKKESRSTAPKEKEFYTPEEMKHERSSAFLAGFLAGCLCFAVVGGLLYMSSVLINARDVPQETTVPPTTQSSEPTGESIPSVGGDSDGESLPDDGSDPNGDATFDDDATSDDGNSDTPMTTQPSRPVASIG